MTRAGPETEAGRGAALDRVTRTMSLALGVGTVVFTLLAVGGFVSQYDSFSPIWSWGVAITAFLPPLTAAALSAWLPIRLIRNLLTIAALGLLAGLLLLVPAITTPSGTIAPELATPWILGISTVGTCAAAVAWRPALAWTYLLVVVILLGLDRVWASSEVMERIALQDAVYTLMFDAIFAALAMATARAGRTLDAAADRAIAEVRVAAATEAASRERSRIEGLVHDSVLVALLASARGAPHAAREAQTALARLEEVDDESLADAVSSDAWVWRLQSLTTDLAPAARFTHERRDQLPAIPANVASAVLEASAEAMRNSVVHAGDAARAVHTRIDGDGLEVTILDDGVGFDPDQVGPARLGVAVSILDRMRSLAGGRAEIVSRPGVGTRVVLGWRTS